MKQQLISYSWEGRRSACPECGSSDGFAHILHPESGQRLGDHIGKCFSCGHFHAPGADTPGWLDKDGNPVPQPAPVKARTFDIEMVLSHLDDGIELMSAFAPLVEGASHPNVLMDVNGNAVFLYRDAAGRGTYLKTVAYEDGHRVQGPVSTIPGGIATRAGFLSRGGQWREVVAREGFHGLLFNQDRLGLLQKAEIVLVESEKTAAVCEVLHPERSWIAAGGAHGLTRQRLMRLEQLGYDLASTRRAFDGRVVLVAYDNDSPGRLNAHEALATVVALGASPLSRIVKMDKIEGAEEGWDFVDAINNTESQAIFSVLETPADIEPIDATKEISDEHYQHYSTDNDRIRIYDNDGKFGTLASAGGLTVIFGPQGSGKTRLVATAIAGLVRMPDSPPPLTFLRKPGEHLVVLDIDQEEFSISRMMDLIGTEIGVAPSKTAGYLRSLGVHWHKGRADITPEQAMAAVRHYCAMPQVAILVVDNLKRLVKNINDNDEAIKASAQLRDIAEQSGTTICIIGHSNPGGTKLAGSIGTQLPQAAQSAAIVKRLTPKDEQDTNRLMVLSNSELDSESVKIRHGAPRRGVFSFDERGRIVPQQGFGHLDMVDLARRVERAFSQQSGLPRKEATRLLGGAQYLKEALAQRMVVKSRIGNIDVVANYEILELFLKGEK